MSRPRPTADLPEAPSDHFDGRRFFNPEATQRRRGDLWRWLRNRQSVPWRRTTDFHPPTAPPRRSDAPLVTWINHATVLIQASGLNLITDPVYSERVSPVPYWGPRRYHPPGVPFDALPPIDAVLISHSHYDHLDRPTLRRLLRRDNPRIVAGAGLAHWLRRAGAHRVVTLDWWQETVLGDDLRLVATPAKHWSRRTLSDRNRHLWVGYWIEAADRRIYFAGDTGLGPHFEQIRRRLGAPDLALLPIGAYEPRWFMAPQHMNPEDAVTAHQRLGARRSLGIHFGTFKLTDEGRDQPAAALETAREQAGLSADAFRAPAFGERVSLKD